jgi:hypothetical protein
MDKRNFQGSRGYGSYLARQQDPKMETHIFLYGDRKPIQQPKPVGPNLVLLSPKEKAKIFREMPGDVQEFLRQMAEVFGKPKELIYEQGRGDSSDTTERS